MADKFLRSAAAASALCVFLCAGVNAQSWQQRHVLPLEGRVHDIAFADAQHGWAVNEYGGIARTTDDGATWTRQESGTLEPLFRVAALDAQTAWIMGGDALFHTTSGGASWERQAAPLPDLRLSDVAFASSQEGWLLGMLLGFSRTLLHTTNSGQSWTAGELEAAVQSISFYDANLGMAFGPDLHRTTDGGQSWTWLTSLEGLWALDFSGPQSLWAVNTAGLWHSADSGNTWSAVPTPFSPFHVDFADPLHGWITSASHDRAAFTNDGGQSWSTANVPAEGMIYVLRAVDPARAWLGGDFGNLIGTANSGESWMHHGGRRARSFSLEDLTFTGAATGWAVGGTAGALFSGGILTTRDGGRTWEPQLLGQSWTLSTVVALDSLRLFAGGRGDSLWRNGKLLYSSSGGQSWVEWLTWDAAPVLDLCFVTADSGWALTRNMIRLTTDGGYGWSEQWLSEDDLAALLFLDAHEGYAAGAGGTLLRTTDGGTSWTRQGSATYSSLVCVAASDANTLWAGGQGVLLKNESRTWHWVPQEFPGSGVITDLVFADSLRGWLIEGLQPGRVWHTTDGGASWILIREEPRRTLRALAYAGERFFAVGREGLILDYGDAAGAAPEPRESPLPRALSLSAYPNPFNPATTLTFELPARSHTRLAVYDLTGRLLSNLADRVFEVGTHTVPFDGSRLASGIYFARLETAGLAHTRKLVLLK